MDFIKIRFVDHQEGGESDLRRTLDDILRGADPRFTISRHRWRPQIDIYETADSVVIHAEIPGVPREEIHLEIAPTSVKISGVRGYGAQEGEAHYHLAEIPCGRFERTLRLPFQIDTEQASAVYRDGILEIRLAKRPPERVHKIMIRKD
jgi:HSP20 family protein